MIDRTANPRPLEPNTSVRNAGIDVIRVAMTMLVILHHTAISYGGSGGWFWRQEPNASNFLLVMFNAINQSYFMSVFFLLAGYYTPLSYERKGPVRFISDRLLRLGLPLLAFFFVLYPLTIAIARIGEGTPFGQQWWALVMAGDFGPGPLWFALALLMFATCYVLVKLAKHQDQPAYSLEELPSWATIALTGVAIGLTSFVVRLWIPVGEEVLWLQLAYFPCYIFFFTAGCVAAKSKLLERITFRDALPWIAASIIVILTLPLMVSLRGLQGFDGGWTINALFYALWDPFVAFGVILGLFAAARKWWGKPISVTVALGRYAFGAFILHPPVVVTFSILTANWPVAPLAKFAIVGCAACIGSFAASGAIRIVPGVKRVI